MRGSSHRASSEYTCIPSPKLTQVTLILDLQHLLFIHTHSPPYTRPRLLYDSSLQPPRTHNILLRRFPNFSLFLAHHGVRHRTYGHIRGTPVRQARNAGRPRRRRQPRRECRNGSFTARLMKQFFGSSIYLFSYSIIFTLAYVLNIRDLRHQTLSSNAS